jgi:hypothetical protein
MTDESARRAFELCNSCIRRIALGKNLDLAGIPSNTSQSSSNVGCSQKQEPTSSEITTRLPSLHPDLNGHAQQSLQSIARDGDERDHALFRVSADTQPFSDCLQHYSAIVDSNVDMQECILGLDQSTFEEMLLTIDSNV